MTYCVALKLNSGMVFASDSRTNAGVDQIACFKKMRSFINPGERAIVILSSGNLSITQNAINLLEQQGRHPEQRNIWNVESMFDVAQLLGECLRSVREHDGVFLAQSNVDAGANFIVGGQIRGERMRLCLVYAEGNFIEAGDETPYFQIGETKYGKPILDRLVHHSLSLGDAAKLALVSLDATIRSNITVGLPFDFATYAADTFDLSSQVRIGADTAYYQSLRESWQKSFVEIFGRLAPFPKSSHEATGSAIDPSANFATGPDRG
jgi:putative proteasome-type protease